MGKTNLWHRRLGHAPLERINKISGLDGFDKGDKDICITCPTVKLTKLPYKLSNSRVKAPFEMIHTNIWGPYKVPISQPEENHWYFLILVDDYTKITWLHLLNVKSDFLNAIKSFMSMAKTKFDKQVKVIRSDNAKEFDDKYCRPYLAKLGIIH